MQSSGEQIGSAPSETVGRFFMYVLGIAWFTQPPGAGGVIKYWYLLRCIKKKEAPPDFSPMRKELFCA